MIIGILLLFYICLLCGAFDVQEQSLAFEPALHRRCR
jgi:hypothetical protein